MFAKLINLFKIREDETLKYMDTNALHKKKRQPLRDPLNQDDEDAFFHELEVENQFLDRIEEHEEIPTMKASEESSRASTLKKMRQCMQEKDWNPKHHPKMLIGIAFVCLVTIITLFALHETPNPLIGKWRPQKESNIFVPTGDIEFKKDQFLANGGSVPVKYAIEDGYVEVVDITTKIRIPFYIKDEKIIECSILGVKTSYKRVKK